VSEDEHQGIEDPQSEEEERPPLKNQIVALLTLLPVVGVLWLLVEYLPAAGDWIGETVDGVVSVDDKEEAENLEEAVVETEAVVPEVPVIEAGIPRANPDSFRQQIVEQLGGVGRAEVRHLAVSDDETRLVAALEVTSPEGAKKLIEVFFERDEFGRYLSSDDSPVDTPLKLWAE